MNPTLEVAQLVMGLAEYYEKQLTPSQLEMYVDDLMEISPVELLQAIRAYRKDPKNSFFPKPAQLIATIRLPDDQRARDAIARIVFALTNYSDSYEHPNNGKKEQAKEYIGELGWAVVMAHGGWAKLSVRQRDVDSNELAQWRELAISLINKDRLGLSGEAPTLQFKPKSTGSLENLGSMIQLPNMKG